MNIKYTINDNNEIGIYKNKKFINQLCPYKFEYCNLSCPKCYETKCIKYETNLTIFGWKTTKPVLGPALVTCGGTYKNITEDE